MDSIRLDCLKVLFMIEPVSEKAWVQNITHKLLEDTCSWILGNSSYKRWLNEPQSFTLWIHGDPGKGKTMILVSLIEELSNRGEAGSSVAYFFCGRKGDEMNTAIDILKSTAEQEARIKQALEDLETSKIQHICTVSRVHDVTYSKSAARRTRCPSYYTLHIQQQICTEVEEESLNNWVGHKSNTGIAKKSTISWL